MLSCFMEQAKLLQYGENLLKERRLDEAFEYYRKAFSWGEPGEQHIKNFVSALLSVEECRVAEERALLGFSDMEKEENELEKIFSCSLCQELFHVPVTLVCGHTFCQYCLTSCKDQSHVVCPGCGIPSALDYHLNIVVRELMRNWFSKKMRLRQSISEIEKRLNEGNMSEFVNRIEIVMADNPNEADLFCLRSRGFQRQECLGEALADLETACRLRPFKSQAFFSRGELLSRCGNHDEAIAMFLRASALKPDNTTYRGFLTSCLCELFRKISDVNLPSSEKIPKHVTDAGTRHCKTLKTNPVKASSVGQTTVRYDSCNGRSVDFESDETLESVIVKSAKVTACGTKVLGTALTDRETKRAENTPKCVRSRSKHTPGETNWSETTQRPRENVDIKIQNKSQFFESRDQDHSASNELECKLCFNFLYEPVTTPCGHSFCRSCLNRCLDHRFECPCCRTSLESYLALVTKGCQGLCEVLERVVKTKFVAEYNTRKILYDKELTSSDRDENNTAEIPIFVCTLAVPDMECPLHIFEPRYKLMVRRCMESGSRQFGMCVPDAGQDFATVGTMLVINNVKFLPDGRSIIHTTGGRRFKVLEKGIKDGYNTAKVEWLIDEKEDEAELQALSTEVYNLTRTWFSNLTGQQQLCIVQALGELPHEQVRTAANGLKWLWWLLAAMPLNIEARLIILSMTSLAERLSSAKRFLVLLLSRQQSVPESQ